MLLGDYYDAVIEDAIEKVAAKEDMGRLTAGDYFGGPLYMASKAKEGQKMKAYLRSSGASSMGGLAGGLAGGGAGAGLGALIGLAAKNPRLGAAIGGATGGVGGGIFGGYKGLSHAKRSLAREGALSTR